MFCTQSRYLSTLTVTFKLMLFFDVVACITAFAQIMIFHWKLIAFLEPISLLEKNYNALYRNYKGKINERKSLQNKLFLWFLLSENTLISKFSKDKHFRNHGYFRWLKNILFSYAAWFKYRIIKRFFQKFFNRFDFCFKNTVLILLYFISVFKTCKIYFTLH